MMSRRLLIPSPFRVKSEELNLSKSGRKCPAEHFAEGARAEVACGVNKAAADGNGLHFHASPLCGRDYFE
jgi:hypothetical protein